MTEVAALTASVTGTGISSAGPVLRTRIGGTPIRRAATVPGRFGPKGAGRGYLKAVNCFPTAVPHQENLAPLQALALSQRSAW